MTKWLCGLASLALLTSAAPNAAAQDTPTGTARFNGSCEANPMLEGMMRKRDHAEKVTTVKCDSVLVEWGKSVTFLRGGDPVAVFSGHAGDATDITMDQVAVGKTPPAATTNGRCRFYQNDVAGELMILCFAAYRDGDRPVGAIATLAVPDRPH